MFGKWYQIYVRVFKSGERLTSEYAKRIDEHLNSQAASAFVSPDGMPIRDNNGMFEIRCFQEASLGFTKFILEEHYGLIIDHIKENE